jgi:hypothetical protein
LWKANGKTTTLSLFLDSLFPKTEIPCIALSGGTVLEETVDLSCDRLLMNETELFIVSSNEYIIKMN